MFCSLSYLFQIEQDLVLLFGEVTFKQKIMTLSKTLSKATQGAEHQELIQMAESAVDEVAGTNADS